MYSGAGVILSPTPLVWSRGRGNIRSYNMEEANMDDVLRRIPKRYPVQALRQIQALTVKQT